MRFLRYLLLFFCFFFFHSIGFAQLKPIVGESYLQGMNIKKIVVSIEDHTVWALTQDGKVYVKRVNDPDFSTYLPTAQLIIEEVTGYNQDEMYFLVKPNLIVHFKLGLKIEIKVPYSEVTRINNIAVVNDQVKTPYYDYYQGFVANKDYLAIATNKHMYKLFRGDVSITETYAYDNIPFVDQPEWRITNAGHFSVDFQYTYPPFACYFQPTRNTLVYLSNFPYFTGTAIPDNGIYPSKINTTLYSQYYIDPKTLNSDYTLKLNFWGTDEGLFLKSPKDCPIPSIGKVIPDIGINDLEEMHALTPVLMQNYVFAATNNGVYYTPASIFTDLNPTNIQSVKFLKLNGFPDEKVNSIAIDAKDEGSIDFRTGITYDTMCEKVIWVASVSGIKKVYCILEQQSFNDYRMADFSYSIPPVNVGDNTKAIFEICGSQAVSINTKIPQDFDNQLLIQWFKDDVEQPQWIGRNEVTLTESGTYQFKVTVLCEGIRLNSIPILIRRNEAPRITFNHPPIINICDNQSYTFQTEEVVGYTYRWFKDNVQIANAFQNRYTASSTGNYRVEVSNCPGIFESSTSVALNVLPNITPMLTSAKTNYCINETAILTVSNPQQLQTKWFLNQNELLSYRGLNEIQVTTAGNYQVSFLNAGNCELSSMPIQVNFLSKPMVSLTRSSDKILCPGESVLLSANATAGASYLWSSGETSASILVKTAGKYSVVVSINGSCSVTSEEMEVSFNQAPNATVTRSSLKSLCDGETVQLSVPFVAGHTYLWSNGETTNTISINKSGNYSVKIYNTSGCFTESVSENIVVNNLPILSTPLAQTICIESGEEVMLQAPKGYRYYTWNGSRSTNSFLMVKQAGTYTLEVEDENGCKANTVYDVVPNCLKIFGPNTFSPNGDGVNDIWNVHGLENDPTAKIIIYNRFGVKIYETNGSQAFWDGKTKRGSLSVGVYYYVIKSKNTKLPITGSLTLIK